MPAAEDSGIRPCSDRDVLSQVLLMHMRRSVWEVNPFGSTKSGIAPFYSDKYAKIGFQVSELFDEELLKEKVVQCCRSEECTAGASVSQTADRSGGTV